MAQDYTCPFCGRPTTLTDDQISFLRHPLLRIENADGPQLLQTVFRVCPNPNCKKFALVVTLFRVHLRPDASLIPIDQGRTWRLVPPSNAKAFPDYVPAAVRADYEEACLILDGSPKASATLSRRCLQGMIRDYWGIRKARLVDEIDALRERVDGTVWKAIDAVRSIGNIGAHMEKDVNVIVDVDPDEAAKLIWLIELLMKEWYIARRGREERLAEIIEMAQQKQAARKAVAPDPGGN